MMIVKAPVCPAGTRHDSVATRQAVPNMIGHDPFKVFYDLVLSISVSCWLVMSISAYFSLCVCPT